MPTGKGTKMATAPKAKSTKTTIVNAAAAPVSDHVVEAAAAAAPVLDHVVEAAAAAPAPVATPDPDAEECSGTDKLDAVIAEVTALKAAISAVLNNLKEFSKNNAREHKRLVKLQAKKKASSGPRKPSGFTKPTQITPELATFIGKPAGVEMARTDVTKEITAYVRAQELQDKENGRKIIPDKKLSALLNVPKGTDLTYFNLQTFLSPHFVKTQQASA